ncbi:DUF3313 domain-containing protein [Maricurvus nonylphenolicus]|uniref:DUF3313 domain-containing protein n=1 Tax=Maricurvus nonylphenolicus TaxID=1008307 RepID=UPI0036F26DFA
MKILWITLIVIALSSCASQKKLEDSFSGFISQTHYEKLSRVESLSDQVVFRYIAPDFKPANYTHVIVDPVIAYPEPQPTEQVSMEMLRDIQARLTRLLEDSMSEALKLSQSSGEGVLRLQVAITGVNISDKSLAVYEYIPVAMIAAGASKAAGARDQQVRLFMEGRVVDTETGVVQAVGIREIKGDDLENVKAKLQAQQLNQGFKDAGEDMAAVIKKIFK